MPKFTGYDVAALDIGGAGGGVLRNYQRLLDPTMPRPVGRQGGPPGNSDASADAEGQDIGNVGSNAWAFAPSRTKSGRAILLRNPHLAWNSGYYEAHLTVPGVVDFYGDFRIGGPFVVVGGFNKYLGFSTTNNAQDLDELYVLDADPETPAHYLFDGASVPLRRELATVVYRDGEEMVTETREQWMSPLGPVVYRGNGKIYVVKAAGEGDYRAGEQFLPHDARHVAGRVQGGDEDPRPHDVELHVRGPRREHLLPLERRAAVAAASGRGRLGGGARPRDPPGLDALRPVRQPAAGAQPEGRVRA
jgi:acyl-homoserine-lactone acylase